MTEIHYLDKHLQAVALSAVKRECARLLSRNKHAMADLVRLEGQFSAQLLQAFAEFQPFDFHPDKNGEPERVDVPSPLD